MNDKKSFRGLQLQIMGWISISIGLVCAFCMKVIHGMPFPNSISETATIVQTGMILPYALGALSLFALSYCIASSYDKVDKILTFLIFICFFMVSMQVCSSAFITSETIGLFGMSVHNSGVVHSIFAILGFSSLIAWIFHFTKSNISEHMRTNEKKLRNKIYYSLGTGMLLALIIFVLDKLKYLGTSFPIIFWIEVFILTGIGLCCLIKGGLILKDKDCDI